MTKPQNRVDTMAFFPLKFDESFDPGVGVVDQLTLNLPVPISANGMNDVGRGRVYRSNGYKIWIQECKLLVGSTPGRVNGIVEINMDLTGGVGWRSNRDLDNVIKPTIDLIRYLHVLVDDNVTIVRSITARYFEPEKPRDKCKFRVVIRIIADDNPAK